MTPGCLDLGARERAADLLIALRLLLAEFSSLRRGPVPKFSWSDDMNSASSWTAEKRSSPRKTQASVVAPPKRRGPVHSDVLSIRPIVLT